jgi:hypothetical protein
MRTPVWLLLLCLVARAESPQELFSRADAKIISDLRRMPNYTCVQTIRRSYYQRIYPKSRTRSCGNVPDLTSNPASDPRDPELKLAWVDSLHFDVALSTTEKREIFSWAGENRFRSEEAFELAGTGPMGTGDFSAFLTGIFAAGAAHFIYVKDVDEDGRRTAEFTYRVPKEKSHYEASGSAGEHTMMAYQGTLRIDRKTANLTRITVIAEDPPPFSHLCHSRTIVDYKVIDISGNDFYVPEKSALTINDPAGNKSENTTTYSSCREYTGHSTIHYEDVDANRPSAITSAAPVTIPPGRDVAIILKTGIDSNKLIAGDPIEGTLSDPIKGPHGKVLVPKGALVHGRLTRMQRHISPHPYFAVGINFDSIETPGVPTPIYLRVLPFPAGNQYMPSTPRLTAPFDPGIFTFDVPGDFRLRPGFFTYWQTYVPSNATH